MTYQIAESAKLTLTWDLIMALIMENSMAFHGKIYNNELPIVY